MVCFVWVVLLFVCGLVVGLVWLGIVDFLWVFCFGFIIIIILNISGRDVLAVVIVLAL